MNIGLMKQIWKYKIWQYIQAVGILYHVVKAYVVKLVKCIHKYRTQGYNAHVGVTVLGQPD